MDQNLLVFVFSVLVFVFGAVFINYSVKREDAKEKKATQGKAENAATANTSSQKAA